MQIKYFNREMGTGQSPSTTGFFGVSCDCRWDIRERDSRIDTCRKFRFFIRTNEFLANGKPAYTCMSGVRRGPWYAYREAVRMRHEIIGEKVTSKLIADRYDNVFLPNYRHRLEELELDWRRPE